MKFRISALSVLLVWYVDTTSSQTAFDDLYVTNGTVYAVGVSGNTIFIGGAFTYVGPNTGSGAAISSSTGVPDLAYPKVTGSVNVVAPDGSGGWYIGGVFSVVGGAARNNIAHLLANKTLDPDWNPDANSDVTALAVSGSIVYAGGSFTTIGGQTRSYLAALDASTGNATGWDPNANNPVNALAVSGPTVYVGGYFSNIGGQTRYHVAALDTSSGSATTWDPNADSYVYALAVVGSKVYAGGSFTTIGGQTRYYVAALDTSSGSATSWDPNADSYVLALAVVGSKVYVGGYFSNIGGQTRYHVAALDTSSGSATTWDPNADSYVLALAVSGSNVYVGGDFSTIGGQTRNHIAELDASTGDATSWDPNAGESVSALAISGSTVYVGGSFTSIGGSTRNGIAALDASTGHVTDWNPSAMKWDPGPCVTAGDADPAVPRQTQNAQIVFNNNRRTREDPAPTPNMPTARTKVVGSFVAGEVHSLALSGSTVYAGGYFSTIGGQTRNHIAAINASTGCATSWDPDADWDVLALAVSGPTVYAGGYFSTIGGEERSCFAALDSISPGHALAWDKDIFGAVYALAVSEGIIYLGGAFTVYDTTGWAENFAALDSSTWRLIGSAPAANGPVTALAVSGSMIYAGGLFTSIGGYTIDRLASIDIWGTRPGPWVPNPNGPVSTLAVSGSTVYAGGAFTNIGGQTRNHIAALDASTGDATSWDPNVEGSVNAIALDLAKARVYVGGNFANLLNSPHQGIVGLSNPGDAELPVEITSFVVNSNRFEAELSWITTTEVNSYGFEVERRGVTAGTSHEQPAWAAIGFVDAAGTAGSPHAYSFTDANIFPGRYAYRIKQINSDGTFTYTPEAEIEIGVSPREFALSQNHPNPFNPSTQIQYALPRDVHVTMKVYNVLGREVATLVNGAVSAGTHAATWNAAEMPSGIYFCRMTAEKFTMTKRLVLMK